MKKQYDTLKTRYYTLTARAEQAERERDLATSQLLMVGSEICGDRKLDPQDHRDPRWTPILEEAAKLRARVAELEAALRHADDALCAAQKSNAGHDGDVETGEHFEDCLACVLDGARAHIDDALSGTCNTPEKAREP